MKMWFFLLWSFLPFSAISQSYPTDWAKYMSPLYFYTELSGRNDLLMSEIEFKDYLLAHALADLTRKVQVEIQDNANLSKYSVNGISAVVYVSSTDFFSKIKLQLIDSRTYYNPSAKEGCAIAFVEKRRARTYFENEIEQTLISVDRSVTTAQQYLNSGFRGRAEAELQNALEILEKTAEPIFWLNFFEYPAELLSQLSDKCHIARQRIKQYEIQSKNAIAIYVSCSANLFEIEYPTFQQQLKGKLSELECSFVEEPDKADIFIFANATTREDNTAYIDDKVFYFTYVDAQIRIDKPKTSQCVYQDEVLAKGGHTRNYKEAGRDAYVQLCEQIAQIVSQIIME